MAFGGVNEDDDWLQIEKVMTCWFCRESKEIEPGSRRGSKSKKDKATEARSAIINDCW